MTFTKEWLQKAISDIETMRDEIPFGLDEDGNNTLQALKMALAGMEAEPVCYLTWHQGFRAPDDCEEYVVEAKPGDKSCDGSPAFPVYNVSPAPVVPNGWVMVPLEPTEDMIVEGFESEPDESFSDEKDWEAYDAMSGCQQAAHRAKLCWAAMISAAQKI